MDDFILEPKKFDRGRLPRAITLQLITFASWYIGTIEDNAGNPYKVTIEDLRGGPFFVCRPNVARKVASAFGVLEKSRLC